MTPEIQQLSDHLKNHPRGVIITAHGDPDIDAIGSCLAMRFQLDRLNIPNIIWLADRIMPGNLFLPGSDEIVRKIESPEVYDTLLVLDSSNLDRVKKFKEQAFPLENMTVINIDHHADNTHFGDINIVKHISSVGELLFTVFKSLDWYISTDIASCLYGAISFDTGGFLYSNTEADTLKSAGELMSCGAEAYQISQSLFESKNMKTFKLIQIALTHMVVNEELGYAYTKLPLKYPHTHYKVIDFIRQLGGPSIFIVFTQLSNQEVKINLRSKAEFNVMTFAKQFGGGGHEKASGITQKGDLDEVITRVITKLESALS